MGRTFRIKFPTFSRSESVPISPFFPTMFFWACRTHMLAGAQGTFYLFRPIVKIESFSDFSCCGKNEPSILLVTSHFYNLVFLIGLAHPLRGRAATAHQRPQSWFFRSSRLLQRVSGPTRRCRGRLIQGFREGCNPILAALCLM